MHELRIDRLTLKLSGFSESESRRLAQRIAQGLGDADLGVGPGGRADDVVVRATSQEGENLESMSRLVVAQVLAQLRRST